VMLGGGAAHARAGARATGSMIARGRDVRSFTGRRAYHARTEGENAAPCDSARSSGRGNAVRGTGRGPKLVSPQSGA
jgi:hypothetical protein